MGEDEELPPFMEESIFRFKRHGMRINRKRRRNRLVAGGVLGATFAVLVGITSFVVVSEAVSDDRESTITTTRISGELWKLSPIGPNYDPALIARDIREFGEREGLDLFVEVRPGPPGVDGRLTNERGEGQHLTEIVSVGAGDYISVWFSTDRGAFDTADPLTWCNLRALPYTEVVEALGDTDHRTTVVTPGLDPEDGVVINAMLIAPDLMMLVVSDDESDALPC